MYRPPAIDRRLYVILAALVTIAGAAWGLRAAVLSGADARAVARGDSHLAAGDLARATQAYREALQYDRANPAAWSGLAESLARAGTTGEAADAARTSLSLAPRGNPRAKLALGRALLARGEHARAAERLEEAYAESPHMAPVAHLLGHAYFLGHHYPEALTRYQEALRNAPDDVEAPVSRLRLAVIFVQRMRLDEAERMLAEAEESGAPQVELQLALGELYTRRAQRLDAVEAFRRAATLRPGDPVIHYRLAITQRSLRRHEEALASADEAVRLDAQTSRYHRLRGELLLDLGRRPAATEAFRRALEADGGDARSLRHLGRIAAEAGDADEAKRLLQQAVAADPGYSAAYVALADVCIARGEHAEAVSALRQALRGDPLNAELRYRLGITLLQADDRDGAVIALEMAAQATGMASLQARRKLTELYFRAGDLAASIAHLEQIVAVEPKDRDARLMLARLCIEEKLYDRAIGALQALLERWPGDAEATRLLESAQELRFLQR
jgi:tetratricopeptide (TPR) repeat protein